MLNIGIGPRHVLDFFKRHWLDIILLCGLLLFGTLYCLWRGRIGYMPLDSPIVFDGGWRLICGQVPFRDFTMPNVIVPVVMQGFLFSLLGVTWFIYCLHAAILNGLFCLVAYFFLQLLGGSRPLSFFYALLSGVIFYPPFGIPIQDQHAYFFSFLLVFLTCVSVRSVNPLVKRNVFFSIPTVAIIAFFSKQIPTIFAVFLVLVMLFVAERKRLFRLLLPLAAGTVFTLLGLVALGAALGVNYELVRVYLFELPAEEGMQRMTWLFGSKMFGRMAYMQQQWRLFFPLILVATSGIAVCIGMVCLLFIKNPVVMAIRRKIRESVFPLVLSVSLLLLSLLFVFMSNNQVENGVPLGFICLGLVHVFLLSVLGAGEAVCKKRTALFLCLAVGLVLGGSSLWHARYFDRKVNKTRMVHDLFYKKSKQPQVDTKCPPQLSFLVWAVPNRYKATLADFENTVEFFRRNPGNFFLLGDSSILYALTDRPSVNPALWFHAGQTMPRKLSPLLPAFQNRLMDSLRKHRVKYVVLENIAERDGQKSTWIGVNLSYFPEFKQIVERTGKTREAFGPFTIIEIAGF